jgi:hypothetical protein
MREPIDPSRREKLNRLASHLDHYWNGERVGADKTIGFAVFIFEFGKVEGARIDYVSNADRADMIKSVKEWLARVEGH